MNNRHVRPADVIFPLTGIITALMGFPYVLTEFFMYYYAIQIFSLCAVDSYRIAVAWETDAQGVNRRFGGGLTQIGFAFVLIASMNFIWDWDFSYALSSLMILCSVTFIVIEQMFEKRAQALGNNRLALWMGVISSALFAVGILSEELCELDEPFYGIILFCATGIGVGIAAMLSHRAEPLRGISFKPRNIRFCLKAGMQALLFPTALFFLLIWETGRGEHYVSAVEWQTVLPLCLGLVPWRLCCALRRRSREESRTVGFIALAVAALGVIVCALLELSWSFDSIELARICADTLVLAMLCSLIVFCRPGLRLWIGVALVSAACWMLRMYIPYGEAVIVGMCALALFLNLREILPGKKTA